jgi:leucyl-tRNA synthetase
MEMLAEKPKMKTGPASTFQERVFDTSMDKLIRDCDEAYKQMLFQKAIKIAFFEMSLIRDQYRLFAISIGDQLNWDLIYKFIRTMVILCAPVISHCSEHVWRDILNEKTSIFDAGFPVISEKQIDMVLIEANKYLQKTLSTFRSKISVYTKPPKKATQKQNPYPKTAQIFVASHYPVWYQQILNLLNNVYKKEGTLPKATESKVIYQLISSNPEYADLVKITKKVMPCVSVILSEFHEEGSSALYLTTRFNEQDILKENITYILFTLKMENIDIVLQSDSNNDNQNIDSLAFPGKPLIFFDKSK